MYSDRIQSPSPRFFFHSKRIITDLLTVTGTELYNVSFLILFFSVLNRSRSVIQNIWVLNLFLSSVIRSVWVLNLFMFSVQTSNFAYIR